MGILKTLLLLPVKGPMDGALWLTQKIHGAAAEEFNNPAMIKRALQELERGLLAGEISEDDYDEAETALLIRLKAMA
ncbi:MAG: hypothetical protein ACI9IV_002506 [Paracoccaceae bacterium]|jgi:hypothetical protein